MQLLLIMLREILLCVALQLALACLVTSQGTEPRESAIIGGRNYYFSPISTSSKDARKACQDMGYELASFETETEFLQVTFYMSTQGCE
ncbi:hypothetical protein B566_EDAN009602 [Ephemera danica]|nr:hypothetical protein B566_EDAN009602 [Ephemera danica]